MASTLAVILSRDYYEHAEIPIEVEKKKADLSSAKFSYNVIVLKLVSNEAERNQGLVGPRRGRRWNYSKPVARLENCTFKVRQHMSPVTVENPVSEGILSNIKGARE